MVTLQAFLWSQKLELDTKLMCYVKVLLKRFHLGGDTTGFQRVELPSKKNSIKRKLGGGGGIFGLFLGITELSFCGKWPYSGPRRSNFNRAIETRLPWSASTPVSSIKYQEEVLLKGFQMVRDAIRFLYRLIS